ncbi:peptidylprolyl isomerase [Streptomyces sulfonofaciens]|uniref:peptidylprolyl isomerase n=1 Tax=Streptomyces sulfonofaciens TaxID=68272 RepID=A0A919FZK0_9ACTN|nr:FKBP-type peptidyl-prolyl cis-trans isomerase [Streptomyces sulfonofaciens]GHH75422.1 peptidylprolyl isomerase [Streptomyces sulfonofaciens]
MRRRLAALLIVPALALTACGGGDSGKKDASPTPSKSAQAVNLKPVDTASPMPKVAGERGRKADITIPKSTPSGKFVVHSLKDGDGPVVKKEDLVVSHYTGKVWQGGRDLGSSYQQGGAPQVIPAGKKTIIAAFSQAVMGQKVGGRVLVVAPPDAAFGKQGNQQLGVKGTDTIVLVLDIDRIIPQTAQGKQAPIPSDLPKINADKPAPAVISVPKKNPPKDLVDRVLIEGKGDEVKNGQTVYMQYSGAAWKPNEGKAEAKLFDSSYNVGTPFSTVIGEKQVIEGWDKGLVGKKVGSRVLLVIPPQLAYKDQDKGPDLPANSTLVFVVDILAAM